MMQVDRAALRRVELFESGAAIELLRASYATHRFSPHAHEAFALGVITAGAVRTRLGRGSIVVPAGAIVALNPGDVHTGEPLDDRGYRYRMLYVDGDLLARVTGHAEADRSTGAGLAFPRAVIEDRALAAQLLRAQARLWAATDRAGAEGVLVEALGALVHRYGTRGRRTSSAERPGAGTARLLRDYLEAEHARVVTLAELSALAGFSPSHVSRTFRAEVGVPPYTYLTLVRVRRARELIDRGYPLSVVTHEAGFSDQSHFTRQFKRVVGVAPGQYATGIGRGVGRRVAPRMLTVLAQRPGARLHSATPIAARLTA
jgi:AraC-like DNA-binding protein